MKTTAISALCMATAGLLGAMNPASAVTVDLNTLSLTNGTVIETAVPGFGDIGPVTVNWDPLNSTQTQVLFWNGDYSGRDGGYCGFGGSLACLIDLEVTSGFNLTLDSFNLGAWPNTDRTVDWSVIDLATMLPVLSASQLVSGITGSLINVGLTSGTGFRISFGPDGYNGGVTQIDYSYAPVSAIPLPAAGFLLIGALGGLAALRRRKTAAI